MTVETAPTPTASVSGLDRYFSITARGSTVQRELRGGLTTFFTLAYIVVLNPLILGFALDADKHVLGGGSTAGAGIPKIAAATALVAAVMTILMGVVGRYPFALATGLGLTPSSPSASPPRCRGRTPWGWWCWRASSSRSWC